MTENFGLSSYIIADQNSGASRSEGNFVQLNSDFWLLGTYNWTPAVMPPWIRYAIYLLMSAVGLVAMYTLLTAGSPDSLLRPLFPNPGSDVAIALAASITVFILGFFLFYDRDREGFRQLIHVNRERIRQMRQSGHDDGEIAESILAAMGSVRGYRHAMARKKLIAYLADFH